MCQSAMSDCLVQAFIDVALPPPTGQSTVAAATNPDGQMNLICFKAHFAAQHKFN